jgi:hypothetical protein
VPQIVQANPAQSCLGQDLVKNPMTQIVASSTARVRTLVTVRQMFSRLFGLRPFSRQALGCLLASGDLAKCALRTIAMSRHLTQDFGHDPPNISAGALAVDGHPGIELGPAYQVFPPTR